ncbi:MAG TPA: M48 family metallopeptidase [Longimicrobium sp.]|nr:M48 family metallopeptidase [Longimicrobium sp.]
MSPNYDALVARLTEYARLHPRLYRARVAGLAVLGYAYLFAALVVLGLFVAGATWFILNNVGAFTALKLVLPFAVLAWMVGRALWVRFTPPEGLPLRPGEAPALMAEIEHVRRAMKAPRVQQVLITDDYNAGVNQYARLGVLGWYRTYLLLGLPYMASMTPAEYRAVLAHEFGHVSRAHGRFNAWIVRVHTTWLMLMAELDRKNHWAQSLFNRFFHWYAPYFEAYTAVLRRENEFEADRMAEEVSPGASGPSLCRSEVAGRWLQRAFWPEVWARTVQEMQPPTGVHAQLLDAVRTAHEHPQARQWLDQAAALTTSAWDTHPALRERLAALGLEPAMPPAFDRSAAEALLGPRLRPLADRLTSDWRRTAGPYWLDQHRRAIELSKQLAELEARTEPLTPREQGERVWLTAELHGEKVAVPMARALLDADQEDGYLHYLLGRSLAEENDEAALPHLERAMAMDHELTPAACAVAAGLLEHLGRGDEAKAYGERITAYHQMIADAQAERTGDALRPTDRFIPHGLDDEALAKLQALVAVPGVKAAYLVRKDVAHFPEDPVFVLALVPGWSANQLVPGNSSQRLVERVTGRLELPGSWIALTLERELRKFAKPIRNVPGAEVYRAPSLIRGRVPAGA